MTNQTNREDLSQNTNLAATPGTAAPHKAVLNVRTRVVPLESRHIVAIGGALSKLPAACGRGRIFEYLLGLQKLERMQNILFINTATGDDRESREQFIESWNVLNIPCTYSFLDLFKRTPPDLKSVLHSQDIIFVNGGNTKSMLAVWRAYGVVVLLRDAWELGVVLAGYSAGGICWFESCLTDSYAESFTCLPAMSLLAGSCCPHYDGEVGRRETYHAMVASGQLADGYAIDECTGIHFVGASAHKVITVSGNKQAAAYRVTKQGDKVMEVAMPATRLNRLR